MRLLCTSHTGLRSGSATIRSLQPPFPTLDACTIPSFPLGLPRLKYSTKIDIVAKLQQRKCIGHDPLLLSKFELGTSRVVYCAGHKRDDWNRTNEKYDEFLHARLVRDRLSVLLSKEQRTEGNKVDFLKCCSRGRIIPFLWEGSSTAILIAATVSLAAFILFLFAIQESLLYIPESEGIPRYPSSNPPGYRSPDEYNIPFSSHMIETDDGVAIHAWLLLHPNSRQERRPTLIFFHGNAGNIGIRLPNAKEMYKGLNSNVLMVEYRGYGNSDNAKPSESGLKLDSEAALRFALKHPGVDPSKIFIFGRSLGGAVTFHLAQYAQCKGIVLAGTIVENTFVSVPRMVDALFPWLGPIKGLILRMSWDSEQVAQILRTPILYLAGDADEIVPHEQMNQLYAISKRTSAFPRIHIIQNGTHNETWLQGGMPYWGAIRRFMIEALEERNRNVTKRDSWQQ